MQMKFRFRFSFSFSDNRKSKPCPELGRRIENLKWAGIFVIVVAFALFGAVAHAQQTGKIFHIGFLAASTASGDAGLLAAFRQEMRKLGWIEGKNFTIEYRFAEQKRERLPEVVRRTWFVLRLI
jgi:hypothetical protein